MVDIFLIYIRNDQSESIILQDKLQSFKHFLSHIAVNDIVLVLRFTIAITGWMGRGGKREEGAIAWLETRNSNRSVRKRIRWCKVRARRTETSPCQS